MRVFARFGRAVLERVGSLVLALPTVEQTQVLQRGGDRRLVGEDRLVPTALGIVVTAGCSTQIVLLLGSSGSRGGGLVRVVLLLRSCQHVLVDLFGLFVLLLFEISGGEIVLGLGHVRIVDAERLRVDLDRALVVRFDVVVLALVLTQKSEIIELFGNVRMQGAETLLAYFQGTLAEHFRFLEFIPFT